MQITDKLFYNSHSTQTKQTQDNSDFSAILDETLQENKKDEGVFIDTESFLRTLMENGAQKTLMDINEAKIKAKVKEKELELMEDLKRKNLSGEQKVQALAEIQEILAQYRKQLMEEASARSLKDKNKDNKADILLQSLLRSPF